MAEELYHYGTKRHSGRYPWGSGENPFQHEGFFISKIEELEKQGLTEKEIAEYFNLTTREYRAEKSLAKGRLREANRQQILAYLNEGKTYAEIARIMDQPWSTVKSLAESPKNKQQEAIQATADLLKKEVDKQRYIDIGKGTANSLGITETRLDTAVQALKDEGYEVHNIYVEQAFLDGQYTTVKTLCQPGVTKNEVYEHRADIGVINERFKNQNSAELYAYKPIESISSDRVAIRYADEGGKDKDGIIEIRRGAEGLDMGDSRYAQVRIAVDGTHYLKGVAVYSDDVPEGADILFNSNKRRADAPDKHDAMKPLRGDLTNPTTAFESTVKKGGQKGYLNIVNEEGDWETWEKSLSSQVLSKQSVQLARRQLTADRLAREAELKEIQSLTNPTVRAYFLEQFADNCEAASIDLKAAATPRQASHIILPLTSIKPNEVYAPKYKDGEPVVLIRHPHGGTFEIPELVVNNNNKEARAIIGNPPARDAIGIHPSVAEKLSGADFDGDTVIVIPNKDRSFVTSPSLKELQGFEPKELYKKPKEAEDVMALRRQGKDTKEIADELGMTMTQVRYLTAPKHDYAQKQMGEVTNLIADMSLHNPKDEEIARAIKYSMVAIDAEKHNLDIRQARKDCDIESLKKKYQKNADGSYGGASTLITRAGSDSRIPEVKKSYRPDPETGEYVYVPTGESYIDKKGREQIVVSHIPWMLTVSDANELSSGTAMEAVYADYANDMKHLAADARKEAMNTPGLQYSRSAAIEYADEVEVLNRELDRAKAHAPLERKAQLMTNAEMALRIADNPDMTKEQKKKYTAQALADARASLGGSKPSIRITDRQWEAIQAGAISKTKLREIMRYSDQDELRERSMPHEGRGLTNAQILRARSLLMSGATQSEVAEVLGVSVSTLQRALYKTE